MELKSSRNRPTYGEPKEPLTREKESIISISSKSTVAFESSMEESWWDIYQHLLQEKQKKKPVERTEIEKVVIKAEKWEDEVVSEKCEVKLESAYELKVEESELE